MLKDILTHPQESIAAIDTEGNRLFYGDFHIFPNKIKEFMPERSLYFMLAKNDCGAVRWTIGGILAGCVPLVLSSAQEDDLVERLIKIYRPPYMCLPVGLESKYSHFRHLVSVDGYSLLKTGYEDCLLNPELSHLLPTSGSTGSPKLVRHKYENIEAAALNISTFFGIKREDRPLMVLPIYYTMGLSMLFSHFRMGATVLITGESMTSPKFWKFMKDEGATSFTGVPYSFQILNVMRFFRMDFPTLKLLTQGGGKMPRELNLKFAEWCRDTGREWIATYGQSEGTARMAYLPPKWAVEKAGSIGIAVPNGDLWLVDENDNKIETPNTEGEMCYRGKNVTMGYATCREDLMLGDERHGWMKTGDLAYFDEDGCYYITGRIGRFLKLFGKRIGLDECEQIAKSVAPTVEIACVGNDDKMLVYLTTESVVKSVKDALVAKTGLPATVIEVRTVVELPKSGAGKILYAKLPKD